MQATTTAKQQQEIQTTLSRFSHEIRNPLALISSELQLLVSSHPEIADDTVWDDIMDNVEYMKELLCQLSDYSNAGKMVLSPTELRPFLCSVLSSYRPTLEYLGITLEAHLPLQLPTLNLDQVKLRQALINLLRNAQESISHPQGIIQVEAELLSEGVCIHIRDNGCGIPAEKQEEIFSPFITFKAGGTGLGLPITRQIIESHGGQLKLFSVPDQGTEVRIFLG